MQSEFDAEGRDDEGPQGGEDAGPERPEAESDLASGDPEGPVPDATSLDGEAQAQYGEAPAQPPYAQSPYANPPYGQAPYGQAPYGQAPYGQAPYGQAPYGQAPYGQGPYGQGSYGWQPQEPPPGAPGYVPSSPGHESTPGGSPYLFPGATASEAGAGGAGSSIGSSSTDRQQKPLHRLLAIAAAVLILAGAVTAGVYIGSSKTNSPSSQTASQTIPNPSKSAGPGTSAKMNVGAVAAKIDPGVVDITSTIDINGQKAAEDEGTGMILTSDGEVLTNNHVIGVPASALNSRSELVFQSITAQVDGSGKTYKVDVLGTDATQDVALVQLVGASGLRTLALGNSADVQVGDSVVAIGNALGLKGSPTVTEGIVSALGRSISASDSLAGTTENLTGLIQTDAPINPGNSGGPLVDADGQVIGMDTAAASGSAQQGATDVGFAIPIDEAIGIAQAIQQGKASPDVLIDTGFMGVAVLSISEADQSAKTEGLPHPGTSSGAYVALATQGEPAALAGITPGDVITSVNGRSISTPQSLKTALSSTRPNQSVSVTWVTPSGASHSTTIDLASRAVV